MSSIGGISSNILETLRSQATQTRRDPTEKFKEIDSDTSGGLDKTELSSLAQELSKLLGTTVDVDTSMNTYDADADGELSQEELNTMMRETLGPPPHMAGGPTGGVSSASTNEDLLQTLLAMLEEMRQSSSSMGGLSSVGPPPDPAEKFNEVDSDGNGSLSQSELDAMAVNFAEETGRSIDMTDAISTYDTDGDGELNQDEMDTMMQAQRTADEDSPPRAGDAKMRQALSAYLASSDQDKTTSIRQLMEQLVANLSATSRDDTSSAT